MSNTVCQFEASENDIIEMGVSKYVKTNDDWFPNYPGNKVLVTLTLSEVNLTVYMSVYGADDFGLEKEYGEDDYEEKDYSREVLIKVFHEWKQKYYDVIPEVVSEEYFRELGFEEM